MMKLNNINGVKLTVGPGTAMDCTCTINDAKINSWTQACSKSFYDEDMLDYLLEDIVKEKAKEAEKKLKQENAQFNKKVADGINDKIKQVIFNDPATIIVWKDGHKTVVKCEKDDIYNKEFGFALCLIKEFFNNTGAYNRIFEKWIKE